jgi:hypothetical protein
MCLPGAPMVTRPLRWLSTLGEVEGRAQALRQCERSITARFL